MKNNSNSGEWKKVNLLKRRETISVLLIAVFLVLSLSSIFINPQLYQGRIHEGDIALKDVYAPYDFTYNWGVDEEKTRSACERAPRAVPYFLCRDTAVERDARGGLETFFAVLADEAGKDIHLSEKADNLRKRTGAELTDKQCKVLLGYPDAERLRKGVVRVAGDLFQTGCIDDDARRILEAQGTDKVVIYDRESGNRVPCVSGDLFDRSNIRSAADAQIYAYFGEKGKIRQATAALLAAYLEPSLKADEKRTSAEREAAVRKVQPVCQTWEVKKNELIIEKGKRVNDRHISELSQLTGFLKEERSRMFFMGTLLLFLLLGLIGTVYMAFVQQVNFLRNTKDITIMLLAMFFIIIVADIVIRMPQPSYFIPVSGMSMMLMLLIGFNAAFLSVILMSILVAVLTGGGIEVALVLMVGGAVGMYAVRGARRRASILWAGLLAGMAKFLAIICAGLINGIEMNVYLRDGLWGISSGLLSGLIVMGLLPVFEYIFKVSTNISLLEMSDLNHPLLKKLAMETPGTYHHSITVGSLAEAACDSINANGLLARVGAYYHDIGKLSKPQYYSENEMGERSKHTGLTPSMSALIIGKHVKEGVEMANRYKLNNAITDFIRQHHGTSLMAYFYQKALEAAKDDSTLNEGSFRYPGPKPQTKEIAIVLLADSIEASSRALDEPTPSNIRQLVKKVINSRFIDGQMDECDLTLKDMHEIADSFVRGLMAIFHTRASYPDEGAKTSGGKPNVKSKLRKQKSKKADSSSRDNKDREQNAG
ncbi:MAG: HDIG domain-containing protein [Candidatus Omnitrophica bacterium]|nr:HDIG domain-containing protein [Candidatus Omnitrophota bacterium]